MWFSYSKGQQQYRFRGCALQSIHDWWCLQCPQWIRHVAPSFADGQSLAPDSSRFAGVATRFVVSSDHVTRYAFLRMTQKLLRYRPASQSETGSWPWQEFSLAAQSDRAWWAVRTTGLPCPATRPWSEISSDSTQLPVPILILFSVILFQWKWLGTRRSCLVVADTADTTVVSVTSTYFNGSWKIDTQVLTHTPRPLH